MLPRQSATWLISPRGARVVLAGVDEVWAEDTRHSKRLFQHLGISPRTVSCHDHNESERVGMLLERLEKGDSVALISDAGTPLISDPGYRLVSACRENGFQVSPIPGVSALVAGLSVSGLPTDRFTFEGFLPSKAGARNEVLLKLAGETRTMIFYESSHRIKACLQSMCSCFGSDRAATLARELTKLHETVFTASLGEILERVLSDSQQQKGEFVIMLAGAEVERGNLLGELDRVLNLLLPEMSAKRAATIAAEITGAKRNQAYKAAQDLTR